MAPPSSYKTILPGPSKHDRSGALLGKGGGIDKQASRPKAVTQACHTCRRYKARCDGARPRCAGCAAKNRPCTYDGEEGQSRQAAMKARLEALEKLVGALQSKPSQEAEQLLHRIRSADDLVSLAGSDNDDLTSLTATPVTMANTSVASSTISSFATLAPTALDTAAMLTPQGYPSSEPNPESSLVRSVSSVSQRAPGVTVDASTYLIRLIIPDAQSTRAAIQSFYSSSGKLFHVFTQEQADYCYRRVFGLDGRLDISQKVAIGCLCAVAAVGVQYNPKDFEQGFDVTFYDVAHHYFPDVLEEQPLVAIKVCTLLAMYNIMGKTTVSLAYVELGLSMSRRHSLSPHSYRPSSDAVDEWADYRRAWRTLIFFSSWLSSTLGYIPGDDDEIFKHLVPLANEEIDHTSDIGEIVQAEMTKISLLKAEILRMHLAVKELTTSAINTIMDDLQQWHGKLSVKMHLSNLGRDDLPDSIRRSIFHVHLLYLGAIMLLYRRIALHFVQSLQPGADVSSSVDWKPKEKELLHHAHQGIIAAKHSSRILGLLLKERGVFERCWLVIFQAHTSCVVLLHSVAQKQIHNFLPSSWVDDLKQAQLCLDTLEFCGKVDPVAMRFHVKLSGIYSKLASFAADSPNTLQRTEDWVSLPPDFQPVKHEGDNFPPSSYDEPSPDYLLTIPQNTNPQLLDHSVSLLFALCRPWGDLDENELRETTTMHSWQQDSSLANHPQLIERGMWDPKNNPLIRWDTTGMGPQEVNIADSSRFLDSEAPSGWQQTDDTDI
ncbi:hypothetical protein B0T17DRAFT_517803 [Bombardia bombarda]|uniref:Zn(2)-C6 fungal-type domain-containing protein n=1 Tax=Bombardia bombarda TaxID=252184 RepID=A0AA39XMI5_9PEZI|nr:hypothetical protein B0T17DRAFT_517803 [Bombardia bombarda]